MSYSDDVLFYFFAVLDNLVGKESFGNKGY